jgi:Flp pilus assembly protein TadD
MSPVEQPAALVEAQKSMAAGRFKEAEVSLRAFLLTDELSADARYLLAYSLLRENKPKDALAEYTRAAGLRTPSAEDLKNVGQAYVLLEDYADAGRWMTRAVAMDGNDPDIWYGLGRLRYSEQKYLEAADCFRRVLALAPRSVKAENNLGLAYEGLNRTDDAVAAYRQAIAWQDAAAGSSVAAGAQKLSEQPLLNLAIVLMHRGSLEQAQGLLARAVAIAPDDARIHEQLGQVYMRQENFADAAKHFEAANRLSPGSSNLHFLLGQAYRRLGRALDAKREFETAARLATTTSKGDPGSTNGPDSTGVLPDGTGESQPQR